MPMQGRYHKPQSPAQGTFVLCIFDFKRSLNRELTQSIQIFLHNVTNDVMTSQTKPGKQPITMATLDTQNSK